MEEISIVIADGELVTVTNTDPPDSNKGKLFWALCGAGGGNSFGVVVEMKLEVLNLQAEVVTGGRYTWFLDLRTKKERQDPINMMKHFYTTKWQDEMTMDSTWINDLDVQDGAIGLCYTPVSKTN